MTLDAKLLEICRAAYGIQSSSLPAELLENPVLAAGGALGINAALSGRVAEGQVICFRGTLAIDDKSRPEAERILDWAQDFHAELVPWQGLPGLVHRGFSEAIDSLLRFWTPPRGQVIFTGHSKGGAMAQLAAALYWQRFQCPCLCVTFAAPRAGNYDFARVFESTPIVLRRYEYDGDVVPRLPFDGSAADILGRRFGVELPRADYASAPVLYRINVAFAAQPVFGGFDAWAARTHALAAIIERFLSGGPARVRAAHSIEPGSAYWEALQPRSAEVHE